MLNYKTLLLLGGLVLQGCSEQKAHFFYDLQMNEQTKKIDYSNLHKMNLDISNMTKSIDETGFSPSLHVSFSLTSDPKNAWPQAWLAFLVNISIKNKPLATLTKSGSLHDHSLQVNVDQLLPKYGIKKADIKVEVKPISWMPTYPLTIESKHN